MVHSGERWDPLRETLGEVHGIGSFQKIVVVPMAWWGEGFFVR